VTTTATTTTVKPTTTTIKKTTTTTTAAPTTTTAATTQANTSANSSDVEMLACVIYQEAGGNASCDNCRKYVGDIVLNRVNDSRFPNSIYGVLTQKNQYGKFYYTGIVWPSRASNAGEAAAVDRAYRVARELLSGNHSKLYGAGYIWQAGFKQGSDGFWCCGHYYAK
jgi:spore germination cell wall hydrolase CwlJ-like protein